MTTLSLNIFQAGPVVCPGFPLGVQPHPPYLAGTRPEDPSSMDQSRGVGGEFGSLVSMLDCFFFFFCAEENRETGAAAQFGGAHQPGGPDPV